MRRVCFYGWGDDGQLFIEACIKAGVADADIAVTDSNLWGERFHRVLFSDPDNISWDQYDMVVVTTEPQHWDNVIDRLSTVYKVPKEKIKTHREVVLLTEEMKGFYKWKSAPDDLHSCEILTRTELRSKLDVDSLNDLEKFFLLEEHRIVTKWLHYFDAYDKFFSKYRGKDVTILEIGVFRGGSLQMWKNYFKTAENKVQIYGIDITPECKNFEEDGINIFIGSQDDRAFLRKVKEEIGKVDILIDDGGHSMNQQIVTFEELFDLVADDGLYLCEDMHTSYWSHYGGGYKSEGSFIEYTKNLIDYINAYHSRVRKLKPNEYTDSIGYVTYCDSMIFIEKKPMPVRKSIIG